MFVHFGRHLHYLRYSDLNLFPTGAFQLLILDKFQNLVSLRSASHQQFHLAIKRRSIVGIVSFSLRICLLIASVSGRNLSVKELKLQQMNFVLNCLMDQQNSGTYL